MALPGGLYLRPPRPRRSYRSFIPSASRPRSRRETGVSAGAIILVVEDGHTLREAVCDILKASHTCYAVRTAEEWLELLASSAFDLIITDIKLPGMDGEVLLLRARELHPALAVIVISGGYGYDERRLLAAGAFGYLLKPFRAPVRRLSVGES